MVKPRASLNIQIGEQFQKPKSVNMKEMACELEELTELFSKS